MTAQELRIGNLTNFGRVYEIQQDKFYVMDQNDSSLSSAWADIQPIPLTEEWLLKFGFENWDKNAWQLKNIIGIRKHGEGWLYLSGSLHVNLFYVHQLQNLFHALTQTELTHD